MMRKFLCMIAVALAIYFIPSAKADTPDITFNITLQNGNPVNQTTTAVETTSGSLPIITIRGLHTHIAQRLNGTNAQVTALLSGCTACGWGFELGFGRAQLDLSNGAFVASVACAGCSTGVGEQGGNFTTPTSVPESSSLVMMGMTGIGLLGALKRKFFTR